MTVASRRRGSQTPNALIARASGVSAAQAEVLARAAASHAAAIAPKSTGAGAASIEPVWGPGWYGVRWSQPQMWFTEAGTRPRTMRELAGKVIPMWIDDPTGKEARKVPAKDRSRRTRTDAAGKRQVLIFRRAAKIGARKMVNGRSVPASYPGAPGRIARRRTEPVAGQIAKANVGVRWRHPGISPRGFMRHSLEDVATAAGLPRPMITPTRRP